jgi:hypothetical protein
MDELGIERIPSYSPQAGGRVQPLFAPVQDRLVKELREANPSTLEDADRILVSYHNTRFSRPQAEPGSAYHAWLAEPDAQGRMRQEDDDTDKDRFRVSAPIQPRGRMRPVSFLSMGR